METEPHIVARCAKCFTELERDGSCAICGPIGNMRRTMRPRRARKPVENSQHPACPPEQD